MDYWFPWVVSTYNVLLSHRDCSTARVVSTSRGVRVLQRLPSVPGALAEPDSCVGNLAALLGFLCALPFPVRLRGLTAEAAPPLKLHAQNHDVGGKLEKVAPDFS